MIINKLDFKNLIIILMILLVLLMAGCLEKNNNNVENNNNNKKNKSITYLYEIEIIPNGSFFYNIYMPAPIFFENKSLCQHIINDIEIKNGDPKISIVDTLYGKALNISGNNNITIYAYGTINVLNQRGPTIFLSLELKNYTINTFSTEKYWIYSNKSNINILINLLNEYKSGSYEYLSERTEIIRGWQIIDIKEEISVD